MTNLVSERISASINSPGDKRQEADETRSLDAMLSDIEALEALDQDWPPEIRKASMARATAIDSLNAEAIRRLIRYLKDVPGFGAALRQAAGDEVVYAVLRRHGILKPSLHERIENALELIRPMLASHGGDVELVAVEPPRVDVRFLGACDGCPASALTFYSGVKKPSRTPSRKSRKSNSSRGSAAALEIRSISHPPLPITRRTAGAS